MKATNLRWLRTWLTGRDPVLDELLNSNLRTGKWVDRSWNSSLYPTWRCSWPAWRGMKIRKQDYPPDSLAPLFQRTHTALQHAPALHDRIRLLFSGVHFSGPSFEKQE